MRGIIYIESNEENDATVLIEGNTFEQNFGYLGSSTIFIRRKIADFLDSSYYPTSTYMPCGGVTVTLNEFTKNFACPKYGGGLLAIHCVNSDYDKTEYYLDESPIMEMDADLIDATYTFDYSTISVTIDGSASNDKIEISSNVWDGNYAGGSEGLIDIRGIHRVHFNNETYSNNGENLM